jgi:undecaprenyl-diphosphatase
LTSVLLVATGLFLLLSKARKRRRSLSWHAAIIIGLAQAVAMLPGCSRSGWTITTALLLGLDFEKAAEFSFILSIPAVCGALILEILTDFAYISAVSITGLAIGAAVAFISGWIALKLLLRIIRLGVFHRFAYYLLPAGSASFLYFTFLR